VRSSADGEISGLIRGGDSLKESCDIKDAFEAMLIGELSSTAIPAEGMGEGDSGKRD